MSEVRRGFVEYIHAKERPSQRGGGTYTSYNAKLQDPETGKVDEVWYQFGFTPPANAAGRVMQVGDYVQVHWEQKGNARRVVDGSLKISNSPPARPGNPDEEKRSSGGGGGGGKRAPTESELFGQIGGYYTEDDVARILRCTALEAATRTVGMLIESKSLKVSEAQGAAGVTKRYEQVVTAIDKLATKYFFDLATGRQLDAHEDEGTVMGAQTSTQPLPDSEPGSEPDDFEEPDDDFPEEDGDGFQ